ncbi:MAG: hypothetical protein LQ338_008305, partial [Usnochroma carphineum]
ESYCTVVIRGNFTTSLTNTTPHLSFNVTSKLPHNRTGLISGEDALCNWVDIVQDDDDDVYTHKQAVVQDYAHQPQSSLLPDPFNPILQRQKRRNKLSCPPKEGKAQISSTILLLGGYMPEARYTAKVKATEEGRAGRTIFDLSAEFDLRYKDGVVVK